MKDYATIEQKGSTAVVWLDNQLESQNVFSPQVIQAFAEAFGSLFSDEAVRSIVLISRKADFIAGADIKSFAIEKKGDFRPTQAFGHEMLERLERSSKPIVAAVHGAAVGLGTELSLACSAIIASDSPRTFFGLPEVKLGLLPGGGGTQRLPRRVGIQKALDMMLTGKSIYAHQAKRMGLVDELTAPDKLLHAAVLLAQSLEKTPLVRRPTRTFMEKILEGNPIGRKVLFDQARKMAFKQSQGNYPAIPAIIECVETGFQSGIKAGYEKELERFEELMLTPESAALRYLFFAMTDNKKNPYGKPARPVQHLGIIGAGFMGAGIAEVSIAKDIPVLLKDLKKESIDGAFKQIWAGFAKKIKYKSLLAVEAEAKISRLKGTPDYSNFEHQDMIIEAVVERMDVKKSIIDDIQRHANPEVIIATNTSSLSVTEMADHAKRPDRVLGMHYFSPVPKMQLLEIVRTKHSTNEVIAAGYDLGVRQGKTCIVVQDGPGFYVNRILAPYLNECLTMIDEGVAIEKVDKALIKLGFPVGPITLLDQVGLDIAAHVTESTRPLVAHRPGFRIIESIGRMVQDGRLGRKNGQGFYQYDPKTSKRTGTDAAAYRYFEGKGTQDLNEKTIQERALMLMLNEAVMCLEEGLIANEADGNLGAVFGIGFLPFTGGPFQYIQHCGRGNIAQRMQALEARYGERFRPREWLLS